MASEFYGYFDSVVGDEREYDEAQFAHLLRAVVQNGITSHNGGGLAVSARGSSMDTLVSPGGCVINGYLYVLGDDGGAAKSFTHAASAGSDRWDRIVVRLETLSDVRKISLKLLTGTPGASPEPPALTRTASVYELSLARVKVRTGVESVEAADVVDERGSEAVCGYAVPAPLGRAQLDQRYAGQAEATAADKGLMAAADKSKLDGFGPAADYLLGANVANDLTTAQAGKVLDARQGKALNDAIAENAQAIAKSASPYVHTKTGAVHNFAGSGKLGFAALTADYADGDNVTVGGSAVTVVGDLSEAITGGSVLFSLDGASMYVYGVSSPFTVPDGELATPINDVQTWVECAGIPYASVGSPSLTTVVASETLMATLANSDNAMKYLTRSETIQTAVLGSATAIAALDASMPTINPVMTSNSQSGYTLTGTQNSTGAPMYHACDNDGGSFWYPNSGYGKGSGTMILEMPEPIWCYRLVCNWRATAASTNIAQSGITIYGSPDNNSWTQLYAGSMTYGQSSDIRKNTILLNPTTTKYKYIKAYSWFDYWTFLCELRITGK